ncbi:DoxX family protein [Parapedobacter sp. ISTM3]|uniref:DoxX family protein n=1 Tax=Parapedobacter sp. ISTM3 TaxID=2800130 RepID=UPI001906E4DD|nr:DoxX family protein [Parapedobacter sp. ISTM3]MBK1440026.1 DoxX family protein [Parapedobacter sp. ISTM3]
MAALSWLNKYKNTGLLLMRIGLGVMFIMHGYPKLLGGPARWEGLGRSMSEVGITFLPVVWGLSAAIAETVGGLFFIIGFFFRPTALTLAFTMFIASLRHLGAGDGLMGASHAIEIGMVFLALAFIGPGRYSVDKK